MMDEYYRNSILICLKALAASAYEQRNYLDSLGRDGKRPVYIAPDELLLEFDDLMRLMDQRGKEANFSDISITMMRSLRTALINMTGEENEHLWTDEALFEAKEWEHVRNLAKQCLLELGVE